MGKSENVILEKTYDFALKVIQVYKHLIKEQKEYDLARQLVRYGTSVGANVEESNGGHSKKDFVSKLTIAYKEARESHYWLRLLRDSSILNKERAKVLIDDIEEIKRILTSIIKSSKDNMDE